MHIYMDIWIYIYKGDVRFSYHLLRSNAHLRLKGLTRMYMCIYVYMYIYIFLSCQLRLTHAGGFQGA